MPRVTYSGKRKEVPAWRRNGSPSKTAHRRRSAIQRYSWPVAAQNLLTGVCVVHRERTNKWQSQQKQTLRGQQRPRPEMRAGSCLAVAGIEMADQDEKHKWGSLKKVTGKKSQTPNSAKLSSDSSNDPKLQLSC